MTIYHLTSRSQWETGLIHPQPGEDFIHFSYAHQWRLSLQRYLCGQEDLVLLQVEPRADWDLRVENGFPHLYQPLTREGVVGVRALPTYRDLRVALLRRISPPLELLRELSSQVDLVVLPELPFQPWAPQQRGGTLVEADLSAQARLSQEAGVAILGGGVVGRANRAVLFQHGRAVWDTTKMHLPQEPGFWEMDYYDPGTQPPQVCDELGFPLGVQLCSDIHRPFGMMQLMRQGVSAVLCPRATEPGTYPRWRRVYQAMGRLFSCYLLSVNRASQAIDGPSLVVGPDGEVVEESAAEVVLATLRHQEIVKARADYPGYLAWPWEVYDSSLPGRD